MPEREQLQSAGGGSVPNNSTNTISTPLPNPTPAIQLNSEPQIAEPTVKAPTRGPLILRPAGRINLITQDGSQYDDDNLRMFQRAGIIIRDKNGTSGGGGVGEDGLDPADNIDEARLETTDENGNVISEPILDLSNPHIKQLIAIYPTYQDKVLNQNRLLFTGKKFYDKLEKDFRDGNVYAINAAFDERFTIKIVMQDIVGVLEKNTLAEQGRGIEMYRNLAFLGSGEIDYDLLISYIDWLISKPNYLEFADNNVVPIEYIADYSIKGRPSKDSELEGQTINPSLNTVPFTPENINAYQNLNTSGTFDRGLASEARRITPDGTGKNIVDGTYICLAPGAEARRNVIIKVYEDLERLRTRIANTNDSERKSEARKDLREKDEERAILVAEHYSICEAFLTNP
jgi:hypothetical protein